MADQFKQPFRSCIPAAKWHQWEPAGPHSARAGATQAFGQPVNTYYDLANANVVVSLDSDFLASGPASLRYARQFAARRRVRGEQTAMNRLYVVEPMPTPDRRQGRPSPAAARRRHRGVRLGAGHRARVGQRPEERRQRRHL